MGFLSLDCPFFQFFTEKFSPLQKIYKNLFPSIFFNFTACKTLENYFLQFSSNKFIKIYFSSFPIPIFYTVPLKIFSKIFSNTSMC